MPVHRPVAVPSGALWAVPPSPGSVASEVVSEAVAVGRAWPAVGPQVQRVGPVLPPVPVWPRVARHVLADWRASLVALSVVHHEPGQELVRAAEALQEALGCTGAVEPQEGLAPYVRVVRRGCPVGGPDARRTRNGARTSGRTTWSRTRRLGLRRPMRLPG